MIASLNADLLLGCQKTSYREDLALMRIVNDVDALASVPEFDLILSACSEVDT